MNLAPVASDNVLIPVTKSLPALVVIPVKTDIPEVFSLVSVTPDTSVLLVIDATYPAADVDVIVRLVDFDTVLNSGNAPAVKLNTLVLAKASFKLAEEIVIPLFATNVA